MLVHSFHEGADILRVHVGVKAVAQVGNVTPCAETLHHLLHNVWNTLLEEEDGQKSINTTALAYFQQILFAETGLQDEHLWTFGK